MTAKEAAAIRAANPVLPETEPRDRRLPKKITASLAADNVTLFAIMLRKEDTNGGKDSDAFMIYEPPTTRDILLDLVNRYRERDNKLENHLAWDRPAAKGKVVCVHQRLYKKGSYLTTAGVPSKACLNNNRFCLLVDDKGCVMLAPRPRKEVEDEEDYDGQIESQMAAWWKRPGEELDKAVEESSSEESE